MDFAFRKESCGEIYTRETEQAELFIAVDKSALLKLEEPEISMEIRRTREEEIGFAREG